MRRTPLRTLALSWALLGVAALDARLVGAADLRDPTLPPAPLLPGRHATAAKPLPRVTAIFISSGRRVAIFDAQPVAAGDHLGPYYIEAVTVSGVGYRTSGHPAFAPLIRDPSPGS